MHAIPAARYLARRKRQNLLLGLLALVALCMLLLGVSVGNGVVRLPLGLSEHELALFVRLRLPRVLMGALVGAGLAMSGTLAQAVLRNPLASPFTLGISSGAAFGAALAILLGGASQWGMAGNAFVFAALTAFAALGFARLRDSRPETLILGGVAIMFLFPPRPRCCNMLPRNIRYRRLSFGGSAIWDAWDGRSWGWPLS